MRAARPYCRQSYRILRVMHVEYGELQQHEDRSAAGAGGGAGLRLGLLEVLVLGLGLLQVLLLVEVLGWIR